MNAEVFRQQFDLESIAEVYGYSPLPEGYRPPEKIDLGIDWEARSLLIKQTLLDSVRRYDTAEPKPLPGLEHIQEAQLGFVKITKNLTLRVDKISDPGLKISLFDPRGDMVGSFLAVQEDDSWNLEHRVIEPQYGGQGIASKILEYMELFIKEYGARSQKNQRIEMEASQLEVLNYFSSKGFKLNNAAEESRFEDMAARLEAGDPSLVVASNPKDFDVGGEGHHKWYVFEKAYYDQMNQSDWSYDDYMKNSVRFKLEKKVDVKVIDNAAAEVRSAVTEFL